MIFSTTFVWNISHFKNKWTRYDEKYQLVFKYITGYSCQILMTDFRKILNYQISWNSSKGNRVSAYGRKDGQTDMTMLVVGFRNFMNARRNPTDCCSFHSSAIRSNVLKIDMKYICFIWPPLEIQYCQFITLAFCRKIFEKYLIKQGRLPLMPNNRLSKSAFVKGFVG